MLINILLLNLYIRAKYKKIIICTILFFDFSINLRYQTFNIILLKIII